MAISWKEGDATGLANAPTRRAQRRPANRFRRNTALRLVAIKAAREKLTENADQVDAEKHRALIEELDLEEQQIRGALGDKDHSLKLNPSAP